MSRPYYYSVNDNSMKDITEEIEVEIEEINSSEDVDVVEDPIETETEDTTDQNETAVGVVTGCTKLRIRKEPSLTSEVVCLVPENSVLLIDADDPSSEWYSVYTESGFNGYCMKKYVSVNR